MNLDTGYGCNYNPFAPKVEMDLRAQILMLNNVKSRELREKIADALYEGSDTSIYRNDIIDFLKDNRYILIRDRCTGDKLSLVFDTTSFSDLGLLLRAIKELGVFVMDPENILYSRFCRSNFVNVYLENLAVVRETGIAKKEWVNVLIQLAKEEEYKKQKDHLNELKNKIANRLYNDEEDDYLDSHKENVVDFLKTQFLVAITDKDGNSLTHTVYDLGHPSDLEKLLEDITNLKISIFNKHAYSYNIYDPFPAGLLLQHLTREVDGKYEAVFITSDIASVKENK